jgi:purine-binding chemotaxis protein CheW
MTEERPLAPAAPPLLVIRRGDRLAGVPLEQIEEVFEVPPGPSPVPGAPAWVVGLTSHHGQAVLLLETAEFLGAAAGESGRQAVLMKLGEDRLGLVVDRVEAVDQLGEAADARPAAAGSELLDRNRLLAQVEEKLAGGVDPQAKA